MPDRIFDTTGVEFSSTSWYFWYIRSLTDQIPLILYWTETLGTRRTLKIDRALRLELGTRVLDVRRIKSITFGCTQVFWLLVRTPVGLIGADCGGCESWVIRVIGHWVISCKAVSSEFARTEKPPLYPQGLTVGNVTFSRSNMYNILPKR